jgi:hypothetical protein
MKLHRVLFLNCKSRKNNNCKQLFQFIEMLCTVENRIRQNDNLLGGTTGVYSLTVKIKKIKKKRFKKTFLISVHIHKVRV